MLQPLETIKWPDVIERLSSVVLGNGEIAIGLLAGERKYFATIDSASGLNTSADGAQFVRVGCAIKLFTASLMDSLVRGGDIRWDDSAMNFTSAQGNHQCLPPDITIRHLLNHTHGLDDSAITAPERLSGGWIDSARLCARLRAVRPLSPPGTLFSYGNAGAWLAGTVLERVTQKPYTTLLTDEIFKPLDFVLRTPGNCTSICPAAAELEIRVCDVLSFLQSWLQQEENGVGSVHARFDLNNPAPLPGWSPAEQGACLGWKSFGSGWFGHNSQLPEHSTIVRVDPGTRTGIVISGTSKSTFAIFAKAFASALPELSISRLPEILDKSELAALDLNEYEGTYKNGALSVLMKSIRGMLFYQVVENHWNPLEVQLEPQQLVGANSHLFIPTKRPLPQLPVLQFVQRTADRSFQYIWNGRNVLRRSG